MIRWHSTTCITCAHYLWNLPNGDLAGYGCAVLDDLQVTNFEDGACPQFLDFQCKVHWPSEPNASQHLERLLDYAGDQRLDEIPGSEEQTEWTASVCQFCGEQLHECQCISLSPGTVPD